jgi:hypothetical protein
MSRKHLGLLFGAAVAVGLSQASAAVVTNTTVPVDAIIPNPCTGEEIHLTGSARVVATVTEDAGGGTHIKMHFNSQGVNGVGLTSGIKYRGVHQENSRSSTRGAAPTVTTERVNIKVVAQGAHSNWIIFSALLHTTVNANGTVTVSLSNIKADECH